DGRGQRRSVLEGTNVDGAVDDAWETGTTLIKSRSAAIVAVVDRGAANAQPQGLRRTAVIGQGTEQRINIEQIAGDEAGAAGRIADQVVALGSESPRDIAPAIARDE